MKKIYLALFYMLLFVAPTLAQTAVNSINGRPEIQDAYGRWVEDYGIQINREWEPLSASATLEPNRKYNVDSSGGGFNAPLNQKAGTWFFGNSNDSLTANPITIGSAAQTFETVGGSVVNGPYPLDVGHGHFEIANYDGSNAFYVFQERDNVGGSVFSTPDVNGKVAVFNGDIDVTGTIDPDGMEFNDQGNYTDAASAQTYFTGKNVDFTKTIYFNPAEGELYLGANPVGVSEIYNPLYQYFQNWTPTGIEVEDFLSPDGLGVVLQDISVSNSFISSPFFDIDDVDYFAVDFVIKKETHTNPIFVDLRDGSNNLERLTFNANTGVATGSPTTVVNDLGDYWEVKADWNINNQSGQYRINLLPDFGGGENSNTLLKFETHVDRGALQNTDLLVHMDSLFTRASSGGSLPVPAFKVVEEDGYIYVRAEDTANVWQFYSSNKNLPITEDKDFRIVIRKQAGATNQFWLRRTRVGANAGINDLRLNQDTSTFTLANTGAGGTAFNFSDVNVEDDGRHLTITGTIPANADTETIQIYSAGNASGEVGVVDFLEFDLNYAVPFPQEIFPASSPSQLVSLLEGKVHAIIDPANTGLNDVSGNDNHATQALPTNVGINADGNFQFGGGNNQRLDFNTNVGSAFSVYTRVKYDNINDTSPSTVSIFGGDAGTTFIPISQDGQATTETVRVGNLSNVNEYFVDGVSGFANRDEVFDAINTGEFVNFSVKGLPDATLLSMGDHPQNNLYSFVGEASMVVIVEGELNAFQEEVLNQTMKYGFSNDNSSNEIVTTNIPSIAYAPAFPDWDNSGSPFNVPVSATFTPLNTGNDLTEVDRMIVHWRRGDDLWAKPPTIIDMDDIIRDVDQGFMLDWFSNGYLGLRLNTADEANGILNFRSNIAAFEITKIKFQKEALGVSSRVGEIVKMPSTFFTDDNDAIAKGFLPLKAITVPNGANDYPIVAQGAPFLVSGNDFVLTSEWAGVVIRNLGGEADDESVFQGYATNVNGITVNVNEADNPVATAVNGGGGNSVRDADPTNLPLQGGATETRMDNMAFQHYMILDSYHEVEATPSFDGEDIHNAIALRPTQLSDPAIGNIAFDTFDVLTGGVTANATRDEFTLPQSDTPYIVTFNSGYDFDGSPTDDWEVHIWDVANGVIFPDSTEAQADTFSLNNSTSVGIQYFSGQAKAIIDASAGDVVVAARVTTGATDVDITFMTLDIEQRPSKQVINTTDISVDNTGVANDNVLVWDGAQYVPQAPEGVSLEQWIAGVAITSTNGQTINPGQNYLLLDNGDSWMHPPLSNETTGRQYTKNIIGASTGATVIDYTSADNAQITLTGDVTLSFTNPPITAGLLHLEVIQDPTGGHNITGMPANWDGAIPAINTGAGAKTIIQIYFDGTDYHG